ncbi:MAG: nitrogenase component 1 [archaeon]|nr:nitrogenase component 1 [archaeon]
MSLENDRPESFLGMMMALEGIRDGYCLVHGPTGCKYYPASVAESRFPMRGEEAQTRNFFSFASRYFFSQPRMPCTYLDMGRFVTGGGDRLEELYSKIVSLGPSIISMVNSPGASLVGEDLTSVGGEIPTVRIDHAEYSGTCSDGFQDAILEVLKVVKPELTERNNKVNLVGLSILHLNWEDIIEDLGSLLGACGIEINTVIGAGWTVEDIRNSANAALNVLVYPEYGDRVAEFYRDSYGIPFVDAGVPIGFSNLEKWILQTCEALSVSPEPALDRIRAARRKAAKSIGLMESYHMLPKGHTFSLMCDGSLALAATEFLYNYLGMIPVAVTCANGRDWEKRTLQFIEDRNIPCAEDALHTEAEIMLTSGSIGCSCVARGLVKDYVEMESPGTKYVCTRPEPPIGLEGTMILIDRVLNIVASRQRFL